MGKRSKKYKEAVTKIDNNKSFTPQEALDLIKGISFAKFDETVDLAIKLNLKKSHSIRDAVVLPHQFREAKRVLVFAQGDKAQEARDAGATYVGDLDLVEKIKGGWLDFDVCVATPDMMKEVGKLGPVLGRRGLMPNPKTRTVTMDVKNALAELKRGRSEFRADKNGNIHVAIGKVSMDIAKIKENLVEFVNELKKKRPSDLKGDFIVSMSVSSTMGPGITLDTSSI